MSSTKGPIEQCNHTDKYEISTDGEPVPELPYPSRLGFLHSTEFGPTISYVDLNKKLCRDCCDLLVSEGKYLVWSVLAGTSTANVAATLAALLPGDGHFPPILQDGSESTASQDVGLPIPNVPEAKEAWQWLQSQSKPFYIDQLHMVVGRSMSPLARKRAAKDSAVALRYGQVFSLNVLPSSSATSTAQPAQLAQTTQDAADSASSVKKKSTSKTDSTKKASTKEGSTKEGSTKEGSTKKTSTKEGSTKKNSTKKDSTEEGSTKKESTKKDSTKKDSTKKKRDSTKKVSEEKKSEGKSKKEKKEKTSPQATDVTISSEESSTNGRASKSSMELSEPNDAGSKVSNEPTKTPSTDNLVAVDRKPRPSSITNHTTELIPSKSNLGGALSASARISDKKGASSDVNAPSVITTTVKTFSRSWGWSEPFKFTTGPTRVPALSDYERVAESRAPSQSTANSLDNYLQKHLQSDADRKLQGPGDAKTLPCKAGTAAASSLSKESTTLQVLESKASKSKSRDEDPSIKRKSKDTDATSKPSKPTSDSLRSGSLDVPKPAKPHETTKKENTEKSSERKKADQPDLMNSGKPSRDEISEQSKQQVRKDASSNSSHRADKKATDLSTHEKTSVQRTKEAHDTSVKVKKTSGQSGSFTDAFQAGVDHLQRELNEGTEKPHKKVNDGEEKLPKPEAKRHGHAPHENHDHSEDHDLEHSSQAGSKPPQPGQSEVHGSSQPSLVPSKADVSNQKAPQTQADPTQPMRLTGRSEGDKHVSESLSEAKPREIRSDAHATSKGSSAGDAVGTSTSAKATKGSSQKSELPSAGSKRENSDRSAMSASSIRKPPGPQVPPGSGNIGTKPKPLDSAATNQPLPKKYQSSDSPVKSNKTDTSTRVGSHGHKMAHEPKRTRSKKVGSLIAHDKQGKGSGALQSKSRPEHTPKRPHAVAGGKRHASSTAAAGVLAGVAAGATAIYIAKATDEDDGSSSDSDNDATHGGASNDDDGTSSESSDGEPSEHGQSDDSGDESGDETHGDVEEDQSESASDADEDQDGELSGPDEDSDNGPGQADESDSGASSNEDSDEEPNMEVDSSEGEITDGEPSGDEEDAEGTQSESERSGGESEDNENDSTDQDSSEQEDDSDNDPAKSSSESEDDASGQETDEEEAEQDRSGSDDDSNSDDHEESDSSEVGESSDDD